LAPYKPPPQPDAIATAVASAMPANLVEVIISETVKEVDLSSKRARVRRQGVASHPLHRCYTEALKQA